MMLTTPKVDVPNIDIYIFSLHPFPSKIWDMGIW